MHRKNDTGCYPQYLLIIHKGIGLYRSTLTSKLLLATEREVPVMISDLISELS